MNKIIEIKQTTNSFAKGSKQDTDFTVHPNSFRIFYPRMDKDSKEWITGLSETETAEYGKKLKVDLSSNSDFWESLAIRLINKTGVISFNLNNPLQFVQYKCAVANKFIALDKEQLNDPDFHLTDSFLYIHDPEGDLVKENNLREFRDECTSLIFNMRTQKEKMFYIVAKLGIVVNESWTSGILYKNLSVYLQNLEKESAIESFRDLLNSDNTELQLEYIVNKAFGKQITFINGQWVFGGNSLGSSKEKVLKEFAKKKDLAVLLFEEVGTLL